MANSITSNAHGWFGNGRRMAGSRRRSPVAGVAASAAGSWRAVVGEVSGGFVAMPIVTSKRKGRHKRIARDEDSQPCAGGR